MVVTVVVGTLVVVGSLVTVTVLVLVVGGVTSTVVVTVETLGVAVTTTWTVRCRPGSHIRPMPRSQRRTPRHRMLYPCSWAWITRICWGQAVDRNDAGTRGNGAFARCALPRPPRRIASYEPTNRSLGSGGDDVRRIGDGRSGRRYRSSGRRLWARRHGQPRVLGAQSVVPG